MTNDRRRQRSTDANEAMALQLRHVHQECQLERIALVDDGGRFVAGSDRPALDNIAAAFAAAMNNADPEQQERLRARLSHLIDCSPDYCVTLAPVQLNDRAGFVCAVGPKQGVDQALERSQQGCQRIASQLS